MKMDWSNRRLDLKSAWLSLSGRQITRCTSYTSYVQSLRKIRVDFTAQNECLWNNRESRQTGIAKTMQKLPFDFYITV